MDSETKRITNWDNEFRRLLGKDGEEFDVWIQEFKTQIENRDNSSLIPILESAHEADIAEFLGELSLDEAFYVFGLLDNEKKSYVLVELSEDRREEFLSKLGASEISPIVENLETDDVTEILSDIEEEKKEEVLSTLDREDSNQVRNQLRFGEFTAGRIMSKSFAWVHEDDLVRKGIAQVRRQAKDIEEIYIVYVTDVAGKLKGYIKLKDLFLAPMGQKVSKLMNDSVIKVHHSTEQEEVARIFKKYDLVSLGVVDDHDRMLGRITVDDVLDVVEEEASEDMLRMGGVSEDEKLSTSFFDSVKRRTAWLSINLFTAVFASTIVSLFESTIAQVVALASLMPIVAGMGGNAGTQSITVAVRNLATGELTLHNWWEAVRKEILIGLFNGILLGTMIGVGIFLLKNSLFLGIVIGIAMVLNLLIASLVGSLIPILLKKFGIDPAIASSIFVTTFTDVCGFFFFLGLATLFMRYLI